MPKSATHQKVIKNGIEGWIPKGVWENMLSEGKLEGFTAVASTPPEVMVIKQKVTVVEDEPSTSEEPVIVEEKKRARKKEAV